MKSRELLKLNKRQSLVEITTETGSIQYCVCSYYDDKAPEGSKWCWGHYFLEVKSVMQYIMENVDFDEK